VSHHVLAIETSCDETAAAVISDTYEVRSSVVASQIDLHAEFGGVVPELASRAHVELITPIVNQALAEAGVTGPELSAVAVTSGPGLVGALLVGMATAKSLALGWRVPIVSVNHLEGHLASVFLADREVPFPQTALLVSGGHCMLTRAPRLGAYELLGETVDDSIGEAYDKVARYPVGRHGKRRLELSPPHAARWLRILLLGPQDRRGQLRAQRSRLRRGRRRGVVRRRLYGCALRQNPARLGRVR
jgi:N6-L-threonylcarbamoyladenine synthase